MYIQALAAALVCLQTALCNANPIPEGIPADEIHVILEEISPSDIPFNSALHKRQQFQLGLYVCSEANWQGNCGHATWEVPETNADFVCLNMNGPIESFGPDYCTQCDVFEYVRVKGREVRELSCMQRADLRRQSRTNV